MSQQETNQTQSLGRFDTYNKSHRHFVSRVEQQKKLSSNVNTCLIENQKKRQQLIQKRRRLTIATKQMQEQWKKMEDEKHLIDEQLTLNAMTFAKLNHALVANQVDKENINTSEQLLLLTKIIIEKEKQYHQQTRTNPICGQPQDMDSIQHSPSVIHRPQSQRQMETAHTLMTMQTSQETVPQQHVRWQTNQQQYQPCNPHHNISLDHLSWTDALVLMIQNMFHTQHASQKVHNMLSVYANKKRLSKFYYTLRKKNGNLTKTCQTHFEDYIRHHHRPFFDKLCELYGHQN